MRRLNMFALALLALPAVAGSQGVAAQGCPFKQGTFRLVEDDSFTLAMIPPDANSAVELARAEIRHKGKSFLRGYITASQGFSALYFVPDRKALEDSDIRMLVLGQSLRSNDSDTAYIVTPGLPQALYYHERELWSQNPVGGEVWQRLSCN